MSCNVLLAWQRTALLRCPRVRPMHIALCLQAQAHCKRSPAVHKVNSFIFKKVGWRGCAAAPGAPAACAVRDAPAGAPAGLAAAPPKPRSGRPPPRLSKCWRQPQREPAQGVAGGRRRAVQRSRRGVVVRLQLTKVAAHRQLQRDGLPTLPACPGLNSLLLCGRCGSTMLLT